MHSWSMEAASTLRLRRKAATDMGVTAGRADLAGVAGTKFRGAVLGVEGSSCCPPGTLWQMAECLTQQMYEVRMKKHTIWSMHPFAMHQLQCQALLAFTFPYWQALHVFPVQWIALEERQHVLSFTSVCTWCAGPALSGFPWVAASLREAQARQMCLSSACSNGPPHPRAACALVFQGHVPVAYWTWVCAGSPGCALAQWRSCAHWTMVSACCSLHCLPENDVCQAAVSCSVTHFLGRGLHQSLN